LRSRSMVVIARIYRAAAPESSRNAIRLRY
jgi:hypothetical protein